MIHIWMIFLIISIIAIIIEIFIPTMFCINFAFAGIIVAIISIFWGNLFQLLTIFIILSLLSIIFLKPILKKYIEKENKSDFKSQYIGKIVKTISPITTTSGAITIFDERWEARIKNDNAEEIPEGCDVKIIANDSTTFIVEKI